jgi:D-alanyl-D-alanine carboxypeptidase/D-alanyl-D-alanine-endopeptidase (penicillin-binding protein 4)
MENVFWTSGLKFALSNLRLRFSDFSLALIIFGQCFSIACFNSNQEVNPKPAENPMSEVPVSDIRLSKPLEISTRPEDLALAKKIDEMIDRSQFGDARWGVFVVSLRDGRVIVSRDGRKLFTPASTQKILTSIVALDRLGPNFRWQTSVMAAAPITDGMLAGDLVLYGHGAPDFSEVGIGKLVEQLKAKGLKRVRGDVVGDESYFRGDNLGDGWAWNEVQWYYGAEASALSINRNETDLKLENGKLLTKSEFMQVSGAVQPGLNGEPDSIGVKRELAENKVYVWGEGKNLDVRVAVANPALWSAKILKDALAKGGIIVEGGARSADWKTEKKTDLAQLVELASVESQTLAEIVIRMNKDSVNLYAELILRTLGKEFGAEAPDDNPKTRKVRGDDSAGTAVIRKWLVENGVSFQETEAIKDGSGLSRLNFVTPETLARALIAGNQIKSAEAFRNSLPIAGADGTLRGRLVSGAGKILAKTGSITYANSLAGYAKRTDETLAFVIFCNNETHRADSSVLIDQIALSLLRDP